MMGIAFTVTKLAVASTLCFGLRLAVVQSKVLVEFFVFKTVSCNLGWPVSHTIQIFLHLPVRIAGT